MIVPNFFNILNGDGGDARAAEAMISFGSNFKQ